MLKKMRNQKHYGKDDAENATYGKEQLRKSKVGKGQF